MARFELNGVKRMDYNRAIATAKRLIRENGREMRLISTTETGNPWEEQTVTETETVFMAAQTEFSQADQTKWVIATGDIKILIAGNQLSTTPYVNQRLIDGTDEYQVKNIETVRVGEPVILWKLHCGR